MSILHFPIFGEEIVKNDGHSLADRKIVRDNIYEIRAQISQWIADSRISVIITTGGTGFTGRDSTPEALIPLFDKHIEGFGELFRQISFGEIGRNALHSFVATFLLVMLGVIAAVVAGLVIDKNFFTLLLSYCPGGIYEVAVIAIFFDLDPEFVSFHHIIRLLMILFTVPIILKIISKKA